MGWKTVTGAALLGLSGTVQVVVTAVAVFQGWNVDLQGLESGLTLIGAALGMVGLGHKTEKAAAVIASSIATAQRRAEVTRLPTTPRTPLAP